MYKRGLDVKVVALISLTRIATSPASTFLQYFALQIKSACKSCFVWLPNRYCHTLLFLPFIHLKAMGFDLLRNGRQNQSSDITILLDYK
jgi:hypothetical protein